MSRSPYTSCRRVRAALLRQADGGLELEARFALDDHLDGCADCRALHEGLALADEGLARLAARAAQGGERVDVDAALARLDAALDAAPPAPAPAPWRGASGRRRRLLVAALVVASLGAAAWVLVPRDTRPAADRDPADDPRVAAGDEGAAESRDAGSIQESAGAGPERGERGAPSGGGRTEAVGAEASDLALESAPGDRGVSGTDDRAGAAPPSDAELERVARLAASARLRAALLAAFEGRTDPAPDSLAGEDLERWLGSLEDATAAVDARLADLLASGWPLARLADGLLWAEEPAVERAAAAYLGVRGDGAAAVRLAGRIDDPELGARSLEALAVAALRGSAGAIDGLARGLESPATALRTVGLLATVGASARPTARADEAAAALAGLLRSRRLLDAYAAASATARPGDRRAPVDQVLAELTALGAPAVAPLYALAEEAARPAHHGRTRDELVAALAMVPDHGPALARELERDGDGTLAFATARASLDDALLPWLGERARSTRSGPEALAVLAAYPGERVVGTLAHLAHERRISNDALDALTLSLLASDAGRFAAWIDRTDAAVLAGGRQDDGPEPELRALAEALLAVESPDAGPALAALTMSRALSGDTRTWAALALAEVAGAGEVATLLARFEGRGAGPGDVDGERTLAAQLLALGRAGGDEAVRRALVAEGLGGAPEVRAAVRRTLERGALAVGVHRVARALEHRRGVRLAQLQRRTFQ